MKGGGLVKLILWYLILSTLPSAASACVKSGSVDRVQCGLMLRVTGINDYNMQ